MGHTGFVGLGRGDKWGEGKDFVQSTVKEFLDVCHSKDEAQGQCDGREGVAKTCEQWLKVLKEADWLCVIDKERFSGH